MKSKGALIDWAEHYAGEFGWSVFPLRIESNGKKPAVRWKRFQERLPTTKELRSGFSIPEVNGLAVVFGPVSGNVGSRDFDELAAYDRWAANQTQLAKLLPTVETQRGRHVYFVVDPREIQELRRQLGKPDGTGALNCGDGELRIGSGCYSAAPPSSRPGGNGWKWVRKPTKPLPTVEIGQSGLFPVVQQRDRDTEAILGDLRGSHGNHQNAPHTKPEIDGKRLIDENELHHIIAATLPTATGKRNESILKFARKLKWHPELADVPIRDLKPIVRLWWQSALIVIGTKAFAETWADFVRAYRNAKFPPDMEMTPMLMLARQAECPPEALDYDSDDFRLLVSLCRELQRACGPRPFFLSVRTAGSLLGIDPSTASRWLECLVADGILRVVEKGNQTTRKATRFRYLPPV